jgi:hypothetical protein
MFGNFWIDIAVLGIGLLMLIGGLAWRFAPWHLLRRQSAQVDLQHARKLFHLRREWLEANFLTIAAHSGKPRGLAWVDCEFDDPVSFARDRRTGRLRALVGVTISFEAIEGGGLEDNPNVGNRRAATAIFFLDGDAWSTTGRAIFNLNPLQAIEHYGQELEHVE